MREYLNISNEDNMELMARYPDNHFDLAIVDPEYGIDAGNMTMGSGKNKKYTKKDWDKSPPEETYFNELFRVSKNQIICGGNYFTDFLKPTKAWIFWDKGIYGDCSFADGELLWSSFQSVLRVAKIRYKGFLGADKNRIHITQKPIPLYQWLLTNYAKEGNKILDTHLGSGSIAIAVDSVNKIENMNLTLTACELDKEYFDKSIERIERETKWESVLKEEPKIEIEQTELF